MNAIVTPPAKPWYKEPWPWLLMAGPFVVVIAAFYSAWLATSTSDGLVTDDYYKKGLAVSETLAQNQLATQLGLSAGVLLTEDSVRVRLMSTKGGADAVPARLRMTMSHPTRAGVDQYELLERRGSEYVGKLNLPASGHWLILLEDEAKSWRLLASVQLPSSGEIVIGGEAPADIRN
jgi:uncharacterized protein